MTVRERILRRSEWDGHLFRAIDPVDKQEKTYCLHDLVYATDGSTDWMWNAEVTDPEVAR